MHVGWDEPKREKTLAERGLDFRRITPEFFEGALIEPAREGRMKAIGLLDDRCFVVIFKLLGSEAVSVISMRYASRKERTRYAKEDP
jgi:uncharacterized DUF497 family protein